MSNSVVTQPSSTLFSHQPQFLPNSQWPNNNEFNAYHLPLQLSQYYNVFPDVPSTKTSWSFPNGCVTSNIVRCVFLNLVYLSSLRKYSIRTYENFLFDFRFTGCPTPTYPITNNASDFKPTGMASLKRKSLSSECEEYVSTDSVTIP